MSQRGGRGGRGSGGGSEVRFSYCDVVTGRGGRGDGGLQVLQAVSGVNPPVSQKVLKFPARPEAGTVGMKCVVKANHFLVKLKESDLHLYDVSINPEAISKGVNRAVMKQLVSEFGKSQLGGKQPVYDGRKGLFTAGELPFKSKDFDIELVDKEVKGSTSARRGRKFKVSIKFVSRTDLHLLQQFLTGQQGETPQNIIHVLNIVLRESPSSNYTAVGQLFFSIKLGKKTTVGNGLECWRRYYQSLRPTQMGMSLNIDVAATSFYEAIPVVDYVQRLLNLSDTSVPLTDSDCIKVKKAVKGLRVELIHRKEGNRNKIKGITTQPVEQLMFTVDEGGQRMSVVQYFHDKYHVELRYAHWPALLSGSDSKPAYLPMEVCKIVEGQRYSAKLNEKQVTAIVRASCQRPNLREGNIQTMALGNDYENDKFAKEFGIEVIPQMVVIQNARVLPAPRLMYHDDTGRNVQRKPHVGQWNMINAKMVDGRTIRYWMCINFSSVSKAQALHFICNIVNMCKIKGMSINPTPLLPIISEHSKQSGEIEIKRTLVQAHMQSESIIADSRQKGNLQLLIIILPDATGSYGKIKRICETELGIISQCCRPEKAKKCNMQYYESLALKINVKAGGRNTVLMDADSMPIVSQEATIIFGADVTHPSPGEGDSSPSIAAVVASMDWPEISKYRGLVSAQPHGQEWIQDLYSLVEDPQKVTCHAGMIRELLISFYKSNKMSKPQQIIFYRDGVSEGQFSQVLLNELDAILKACASLEEGYRPRVTFVVVQKRHHTRLFPANHGNKNMTDSSGNILPGTVVDSVICHPSEFDFYLCSHASIQGTSRPTHYHVLWDENNFNFGYHAGGLQTTYAIVIPSALYARCTRSVSIVPPVYYAHLAAFRARYYIEGDVSDSRTGASATSGQRAEIRSLPKIKDNVKDVMFYC
ncbi:hypothetical protein IFM89_022987 [Coptis chinensis]|uniref:Uncharacterized protein n=1 Tax=Coptis chinensis TaxID=261450 RepID=A0A835ID36_9MAGN|nr:hypothetical protein IFM89_022987 [Coptis chinensis]